MRLLICSLVLSYFVACSGKDVASSVLFARRQTSTASKVDYTELGDRVVDLNNVYGGWAVLPALSMLNTALQEGDQDWVLFLDSETAISSSQLKDLAQLDASEPRLLARTLKDSQHSIIHHYHGDFDFEYPDFACGWAMSKSLVQCLARHVGSIDERKVTFTIDAQHEVAKLAKELCDVAVSESPLFCATEAEGCLAYIAGIYSDSEPADVESVAFGIKTASKFHETRLQFLIDTWGHSVPHITYYSDLADTQIPTRDTGVPNTERGHCEKLRAIMKDLFANHPEAKWFVVADDDTQMRVDRLLEVLSAYNSGEPVIVGEIYGFRLLARYGYGYPTGGSGMAFSHAAMAQLVENMDKCPCAAIDSPDDMWLGMNLIDGLSSDLTQGSCSRRLDVPLVHHSGFHQAKPQAYADRLLEHQLLISFHKCIKPGDCAHRSEFV